MFVVFALCTLSEVYMPYESYIPLPIAAVELLTAIFLLQVNYNDYIFTMS